MLDQLVQFMNALWLTIVPEGSLKLPDEVYSVLALTMRYWFLLLMAVIVLCCFQWYRRDNRIRKKQMGYLPDAGHIGQMVVIQGNDNLPAETILEVPREGTIGSIRTNDLCLPDPSIASKHLRFTFDETQGLLMYTCGNTEAKTEEKVIEAHQPTVMVHGTRLYIGPYELRLRLFAGFPQSLYPQQTQTGTVQFPGTMVYPATQYVMPVMYMPVQMPAESPSMSTTVAPAAQNPVKEQNYKAEESVMIDHSAYKRPKAEEPVSYPFAEYSDDNPNQNPFRFDADCFPSKKEGRP